MTADLRRVVSWQDSGERWPGSGDDPDRPTLADLDDAEPPRDPVRQSGSDDPWQPGSPWASWRPGDSVPEVTPTPNVALLRQTLAYIEAHPEEWNQAVYHCGSAACFAGHAALLTGARWDPKRWSDSPRMISPGAELVYVADYAQRALLLDDYQADLLFGSRNSLDDLRRIVADLTAGAS